ncbi:MAG: hypothetical protein GYA60_07750 [Candidatus Methanofastidiosa archaeon]|nr:hypothetical protein [Candidatus Methanofastidiosa archaeon]
MRFILAQLFNKAPLKEKIKINNLNDFSDYFDEKLNNNRNIKYLSWSSGGVVDHIDIILNERTIFEIDKFDSDRGEIFYNKKYYYYRTTNYLSNHILIGFIENRYEDIDILLNEYKKTINVKNMRELLNIRNQLTRINEFLNECENVYPRGLEIGIIDDGLNKNYLISTFNENTKEKRGRIDSFYNQIADVLEMYSLEVAEKSLKNGEDSLKMGRYSLYAGLMGILVGFIGLIISYLTIEVANENSTRRIFIRRLIMNSITNYFYRLRNWLWRNIWNRLS